jgi:hypothetical protein
VNTTYGLRGDQQVEKSDPRIASVHAEVSRQYAAGRSTGFSPDEMQALTRLHFGNAVETSRHG